jgi:hypothetical protein
MKLTDEINSTLSRLASEDHVIQNGVRDALFDAVGPIFDQEGAFFPLRPSSCLKPMRDLYYDLINYYKPGSIPKAPFENRIKLIFQFGHMTETLLKKLFAYKFGVKFEQERVQYGTLTAKDGTLIPLTGSIDWATERNGETILCDAKSIGDFPFKKAPKEDNIAQMQLYMHSDWGRKNNVNRAQLIYFNKNTCDIKVAEVQYNAQLAEKLLQRLQLVFDYFKNEQVPPREYFAGIDWQANYSAYIDYDNAEFTVPLSERLEIVAPDEVFGTDKQSLRRFVEKYGNAVVFTIDKEVFVTYDKGKLTLTIKELNNE